MSVEDVRVVSAIERYVRDENAIQGFNEIVRVSRSNCSLFFDDLWAVLWPGLKQCASPNHMGSDQGKLYCFYDIGGLQMVPWQ
ncbi:hypothetical protein NPIL_622861 [Nephila pilipes]|uniref:Uncharacterized protein n=1 Tax=Nephila pilipes TaxID=299642 RepID=A0A8X6T600_NEPPI|nr:hypothetical protein NPIL_622861 [Nephila pilipes]